MFSAIFLELIFNKADLVLDLLLKSQHQKYRMRIKFQEIIEENHLILSVQRVLGMLQEFLCGLGFVCLFDVLFLFCGCFFFFLNPMAPRCKV